MSRFGKLIFLGAVLVPMVGATAALAQLGACCIPPSWQCFVGTRVQCDGINGQWEGDGVTCQPNP